MIFSKIEKCILLVNKIDSRIFLLILLSCNFLGFAVNNNEEQYFAFAKQYVNPDWISSSFSLSDVAGTRILFQLLAGILLHYISFEQLAFWGRFVNYILYAIVLAKLFKKFSISNFEAFFFLQVIYFSHQAIFAGEWMFGGLETKTVSYFFLLYSLFFLLEKKHFTYILFAALSTCFHILVGGWFFIVTFVYFLLFFKISFKRILLLGSVYVLLISPFLVYLFRDYYMNSSPGVINDINVNHIYVYFRNPHHLVIFKSLTYFLKYRVGGVFVTLFLCFFCILYFSTIGDEDIASLNKLNIVIFIQQILSIIAAIFDRNGVLLKYYPYRTSALSSFLMTIQIILYLKKFGNQILLKEPIKKLGIKNCRFYRDISVTFATLTFFMMASCNNLYRNVSYSSNSPDNLKKQELYAFIKDTTNKGNTFLFYTKNDHDLAFIRNTERELFFVDKFIPTTNSKIYEWYMRAMEKRKALENVDYLFTLKEKYDIDYVISLKPVAHNKLRLVFNNSGYFIYELQEKI